MSRATVFDFPADEVLNTSRALALSEMSEAAMAFSTADLSFSYLSLTSLFPQLTFPEGTQLMLEHPRALDIVDLGPTCTPQLCLRNRLCQREPRLRRAQDELVVRGVDGGRDERRALGVGARDGEHCGFEEVELKAGGDEARGVGGGGNEDFASKVAALFRCEWDL